MGSAAYTFNSHSDHKHQRIIFCISVVDLFIAIQLYRPALSLYPEIQGTLLP